jgi:GTP-binding protein Era
MQKEKQVDKFRSGFVAVMGKPNVGKSTLVNAMLQQKVAAVSPRPQTTRKRQMGILTLENAQVIFVDTPGVHKARHKLGEAMNQEALSALAECDLILWIVDVSEPPDKEDLLLAGQIGKLKRPIQTLIALNKVDLIQGDEIPAHRVKFEGLLPLAHPFLISAARGDGIEDLLRQMIDWLPENPPFFPEDQVTDLYERDLAADLIREAALIILRDEVPHGIAIRIDQFTERGDNGAYIEATIFVEKETHKGIVIGQGGNMLKQIGSRARAEIEAMSGRKVYLDLRVKVRKNWRNDEQVLGGFGFGRRTTDDRR